MGLVLDYCEDEDMQRVFEIMSEAFQGEPYIDAVFPNHTTSAGRLAGGKRLLESKRTEKNATFLKVTDSASGTIIGQAKWLIFEQAAGAGKLDKAKLSDDYWATEDDKEYASYLYAQYTARRRQAISSANGPLIGMPILCGEKRTTLRTDPFVAALDLLTVDPKHQSRGAGTMLLKWGTELGDRIGAEVCPVHYTQLGTKD